MKVFITGTFRSGTTLISQMLNQSSSISVTYDSVHFMRFGYMKYGKNSLSKEAAVELGKDFNQRLTQRFQKGFDFEEYRRKVFEEQKITYGLLWDLIMQGYVGNKNWGEKTVLQWRNSHDILEMFDDIKIIHCVRDPRDVLSSWKNETYAPGVDYLDAIGNCYDSMLYARLGEAKFPTKYMILRFEDLLSDPKRVVSDICKRIGVDFEEGMLNPTNFKNKVSQEKWEPNSAFNDPIEGISTKPISRWQKHLETEDLVLCELANRENMEYFNYTPSEQIRKLNIELVFKAISKLHQSPLALNGILQIVHFGQGVQRNPLNDLDPKTWETKVSKL